MTTGEILTLLTMLSVLMVMASLVATPILLVRIPADYFKHEKPHLLQKIKGQTWLQAAALVVKNLLGGLLFVAGIAMLVLPGQGLLTILIGLLLMDFPGKFRLERWIIERPRVRVAVNWLRAKYGHPPLDL